MHTYTYLDDMSIHVCIYIYSHIYIHAHPYITIFFGISRVGSPIFCASDPSGAAMPSSALSQPKATATAREPHGGAPCRF